MIDIPASVSGRSLLEITDAAARQAGVILKKHFRGNNRVEVKGKSNLVTQVDVMAEKAVLSVLFSEFPQFGVLSEETNNKNGLDGYRWVVDPLDGTNNYVYGIPFFCVNIALAKDGVPLFGLTYDPIHDERFHAESGRGAFLNGMKIQVSGRATLDKAILGLDIGYDVPLGDVVLNLTRQIRPEVHSIRAMGSASLALAYVACGRIDLYYHKFLYPWDIAPGIVLIKEAGGETTDWDGKQATARNQQIIGAVAELGREFRRWTEEHGFRGRL
jgi:myo-inositol-1(or 4)-monophosphatase